jgi:protocatechuate 3,4-dioxygenase, beta subunit
MNYFLSVIILLFASTIYANEDLDEFHLNRLNFCKISKSAVNDYEPKNFNYTNNLLHVAGTEELYCGEKIIIRGVVLDQNCVPLPDAKIYMWQVGCDGKYPYLPLKNIANKDLINLENNLTFTGNGTATTNNNGEFVFITIYPVDVHDLASHVNVRIEHRYLGTKQVRLMLKGHKVQYPFNNPELKKIAEVAAKTGASIYDFKIVVPGDSNREY